MRKASRRVDATRRNNSPCVPTAPKAWRQLRATRRQTFAACAREQDSE